MKKETILRSATDNLNIPLAETQKLNSGLIEYEKNRQSDTAEDLAKGILNDMPELMLLHNSSMREYARITANNTSTIRIIVIIYFIISIFAAFIFIVSSIK